MKAQRIKNREIVGEIFAAVDAFVAGIEAISPLRVLGRPDAYLVAHHSRMFDELAKGFEVVSRVVAPLHFLPRLHAQ